MLGMGLGLGRAMRFVAMVRVLARIAGMMVLMRRRRDVDSILRKGARAAGAVIRAFGGRLVHDAADRPRTAAALRAAAETAVDLAGHAWRIGADHGPNLMIGQDVTGTDDHLRRFSVRCYPFQY